MRVEDIRRIAVVGAGTMGHGLAQEFAVAGYEVSLVDVDEPRLAAAMRSIAGNLEMLVGLGLLSHEQAEPAPARIHPTTSLAEAAADADYVVEAVFENLPLKQQIFRQLDEVCPPRTILASNTSALLPSGLAAVTSRPDRVVVTHYFNPPYLLPLVEIVRAPTTSDETVATVRALLTGIGKQTAVLQKETEGFIANRLQCALFREALSIVEHGIASPQEVDVVVRSSIGRRWAVAGPFEIFDAGGHDTVLTVLANLGPLLESSGEPQQIYRDMVARGDVGLKSGKGFYAWTPESAQAYYDRMAEALSALARLSAGR